MNAKISVIVPVFNEEENIAELVKRLGKALGGRDYELIFVNDGSRDATLPLLIDEKNSDDRITIVDLSRNFGHQAAMMTGFNYATGEYVILMDGDLQDPPEVLPGLIDKIDSEGLDVISAVRKKRKENLLLRFCYFLFYRLYKKAAYINVPLDSGDFCIMRKVVADQITNLPESKKFIRGLRSWVGYKQGIFEYERGERFAGEPKYRLKTLIYLALDGLTSFSYLPLRMITSMGFIVFSLGLFFALYTFLNRLFNPGIVEGYTTIEISILVLGGLQLLAIGIIGEYIAKIFDETKKRPISIVRKVYR